MEKEQVLIIATKYIKKKFTDEATGHDWHHIERLLKTAKLINQQEKADEFKITIMILFHDLYDHKFYKGNPSEALINTFEEIGIKEYFTADELETIIYDCNHIGFQGKTKIEKPLSKEGEIAQDADRLDGIGAIGIVRCFSYMGNKGKPIYQPEIPYEPITPEEYCKSGSRTSINHFYDKLLKVKDLMNTQTAKQIAEKRHQFMEGFLDEFYQEWNGEK